MSIHKFETLHIEKVTRQFTMGLEFGTSKKKNRTITKDFGMDF